MTTTQDVDAAKALTSMHGSRGSFSSERGAQMRASLLPPIATNSLLRSPDIPPPRASSATSSPDRSLAYVQPASRPADLCTPSSHARSQVASNSSTPTHEAGPLEDRKEEDNTAAELMMFLAHSPSPLKRPNPSTPARTMGDAARVLFAEPLEVGSGAKVAQHSNLVMATPITAGAEGTEEVEDGQVGS